MLFAPNVIENIMAIDSNKNGSSSLAEFFSRHREALQRYIGNKLRHGADAEDVVQETFIRLLNRERTQGKTLQSMASPEAYMYRTASNLAIDRQRQKNSRVDEGCAEPLDNSIESTAPGALRVIESHQRLQRLRDAVDQLPPMCRQVFVLHKYRQLTYREVASHLGISVSMVEKHMMKALTRLDKALGGSPDGRL